MINPPEPEQSPQYEGVNTIIENPEIFKSLREGMRSTVVDSYIELNVPIEAFHNLQHTFDVVEISDAVFEDSELYEMLEVEKELERFNGGIESLRVQQVQSTSDPFIQGEISRIQNNLKLTKQELKDVFAMAFYFHDISNWDKSESGGPIPNDRGAEIRSINFARNFIATMIVDQYGSTLSPERRTELVNKYTYAVEFIISSTDLDSDKDDLNPSNPKPFAKYIKFCDRISPYLKQSQGGAYTAALNLAREKTLKDYRERDIEDLKTHNLRPEFILNFAHYELEKLYGVEKAAQIKRMLGYKGRALYPKFIVPDAFNKLGGFTWLQAYQFLSQWETRQNIFEYQQTN